MVAQGIIGGGTSYQDQSIQDILEDINNWVKITIETKELLENGEKKLKECSFWDQIPFDFQMTLLSSITCQKTILDDFKLIIKAIEDSKITEREVRLLKKIGTNAAEYNREYGKTYKEESHWKKYGDTDFKVAENLYAKGRDYFVTLQDATNAASRLNDYINTLPPINAQYITQNISGNSNQVAAINHGVMTLNNVNKDQLISDIELAITKIKELEDIEEIHKNYINRLLTEVSIAAINNNDQKIQGCKDQYKAFIIGAGKKFLKVIEILSSFASIASFLGIKPF